MRWRYAFLFPLVLACSASLAWGHGFNLSLTGNSLGATSNSYPANGNPYLFGEVFEEVLGELTTDHGAAGASLFGTGKELSFEVLGPLWYSNGNPAVAARDGLSLLVEGDRPGFPGSIEIDGASSYIDGYAISGNTSHEFLSTLTADLLAPFSVADEGVYGIMYRVKGSPVGGSPYEPTAWLVSTWMTPGFFPGSDPLAPTSPLNLARNAIYSAAIAVPEPSAIALAGAASIVVAAFGCRRCRIA
ncbi:MAG: hypothetical protein WD845_11055 [Pirellulales bacterium]